MRVLVCGSRNWMHESPIKRVLISLKEDGYDTLTHGDARGADRTAAKLATSLGYEVVAFPADWSKGLSAGPVRNQRMLDEGKPDRVVAFPMPDSKGTWDMVRRAQKAGLPVNVVKYEGL